MKPTDNKKEFLPRTNRCGCLAVCYTAITYYLEAANRGFPGGYVLQYSNITAWLKRHTVVLCNY